MIEGPASPFLKPLVGLQCTLAGPIKKVRYQIIEVTYNAYIRAETVYLVSQSYDGSRAIRREPLSEIMLTEESREALVKRIENYSHR
jgi:hypothetical protein